MIGRHSKKGGRDLIRLRQINPTSTPKGFRILMTHLDISQAVVTLASDCQIPYFV